MLAGALKLLGKSLGLTAQFMLGGGCCRLGLGARPALVLAAIGNSALADSLKAVAFGAAGTLAAFRGGGLGGLAALFFGLALPAQLGVEEFADTLPYADHQGRVGILRDGGVVLGFMRRGFLGRGRTRRGCLGVALLVELAGGARVLIGRRGFQEPRQAERDGNLIKGGVRLWLQEARTLYFTRGGPWPRFCASRRSCSRWRRASSIWRTSSRAAARSLI